MTSPAEPGVKLGAPGPGIARITLARPAQRNALNRELLSDLEKALHAVREDRSVRVVVLSAEGSVFCAGGDLSSFRDLLANGALDPQEALSEGLSRVFLGMHELRKPIIAEVSGHAMGGGVGLVAAADLALAADDVELALPEVKVGLWPMVVTAEILRCMGRKTALELMLTARRVPATEAATLGLVSRAVPRAQLGQETLALATQIAQASGATIRRGMAAFYDAAEMEYREALRYLERQFAYLLTTPEAREGITAFLEKRPPRWPDDA